MNRKHAFDKNNFNINHDMYKSDAFSLGLVILNAATLKDIYGFN